MSKPKTMVKDGKTYTLDKNVFYRYKGQIMAGQNHGALKLSKRKKREAIVKATPSEIRGYFRECLPDVMDTIIEQAKKGCTASQRLILDKVAPNLKSVEMTGQTALPTLVIQQLIKGEIQQAEKLGQTIESDSNHAPIQGPDTPPENH
mgnify:FL=1